MTEISRSQAKSNHDGNPNDVCQSDSLEHKTTVAMPVRSIVLLKRLRGEPDRLVATGVESIDFSVRTAT